MIKMLLVLCLCQLDAKEAFASYPMQARVPLGIKAKMSFDSYKCICQNCDCKDCKCTDSFDAIYKKAIKDNQVIVLAVSAPKIDNVPWKIIELKTITGEQPGYIVGVPKNGELIRLDFAPNTTKQRIRLDILHVYYPLTDGYVECPTCPYGRIKR